MADGAPEPSERSPLLREADRPASKGDGPAQDAVNHAEESNQPAETNEDPEMVKGRNQVKSMLPVLSVGIFLAFLDQSIVAAINGDMGSELHAAKNVSWIATAYYLTMTASQPLYGRLSDVFGRKPCLLFAYVMFGFGSLGCGVANSMAGLIAARVILSYGCNEGISAETSRLFKA